MRLRARALVESPFRYPGGKSRLVPTVRAWLCARGGGLLIEPFAGGGSVSLAAVSEGLVRHAVLNEVDQDVAAVWSVMLSERAYELVALVDSFELTDDAVARVLSEPPESEVDRAFATLLRNRVAWAGNHGAGWWITQERRQPEGVRVAVDPERALRSHQRDSGAARPADLCSRRRAGPAHAGG